MLLEKKKHPPLPSKPPLDEPPVTGTDKTSDTTDPKQKKNQA
jgi:hypothetical protein